jgi:hypothetical protein
VKNTKTFTFKVIDSVLIVGIAILAVMCLWAQLTHRYHPSQPEVLWGSMDRVADLLTSILAARLLFFQHIPVGGTWGKRKPLEA